MKQSAQFTNHDNCSVFLRVALFVRPSSFFSVYSMYFGSTVSMTP